MAYCNAFSRVPYLRMVTRTDFSAARSWRSSIKYVRSALWCFAVQWSSNISTLPPVLLTRPPNTPALPSDFRLLRMFLTIAWGEVRKG